LLPDRDHSDTIPSVVALAGVMLGKCSALSADGFNRRLTDAVKTGLQEKAMVIRAYTHLFLELVPASDFDQDGRSAFSPPFLDDEVVCREAVELGWTEGDGPGYSEERSREFIANRYRRAMRPIRFTLPRLVADPVVGPKLLALRAKGVKDWEILLLVANRVVGYRAELIRPRTSAEHKRVIDELMNKEEDDASPSVPLEIFSDEQINTQLMTGVAAMAKTWDLHLHRQTPDFKALRRLLEARYHIGRDDIPHDDIFGCKTE
jgi:hypothetical protein